ncbi:MAG: 16S rRNA (cytosine967-C5)-methyltransferase [Pseudohongiellaceae bacterium]
MNNSKKTKKTNLPLKKETPRIIATQIMAQLLKQQGSLASLMPQYITQLTLQQQSFVKELCYGCCRWSPVINAVLDQLLKQKLKPKDADIKAILLLGIYQLEFLRTAEYAAINESVNATIYFKKQWAKNLVNAILRGFQRDQQSIFIKAQQHNKSNHPKWLEIEIEKAWPAYATAIFAANNQAPPLTLRVNQQQHSRAQYIDLLKEANIEVSSALISEDGLYLHTPMAVTALPDFDKGAISVQDEAGQLAAKLLKLEPNLRVLDACCAPGGKTCHIGESEPGLAKIIALDIEARRLNRVEENLKRLHISADVVCGDASEPDTWWDGQKFDRILIDAPCSATGIIRRQPDIKLLRELGQIKILTQIQYRLVCALWPLLADGGILLYATCSILPQENTKIMEQFLNNTADASVDPIIFESNTPTTVADSAHSIPRFGIEQDFGRQLLPLADASEDPAVFNRSHDGFYYCRLKKALKKV